MSTPDNSAPKADFVYAGRLNDPNAFQGFDVHDLIGGLHGVCVIIDNALVDGAKFPNHEDTMIGLGLAAKVALLHSVQGGALMSTAPTLFQRLAQIRTTVDGTRAEITLLRDLIRGAKNDPNGERSPEEDLRIQLSEAVDRYDELLWRLGPLAHHVDQPLTEVRDGK